LGAGEVSRLLCTDLVVQVKKSLEQEIGTSFKNQNKFNQVIQNIYFNILGKSSAIAKLAVMVYLIEENS